MILVYRDEIGYVGVKVDNKGVDFLDGYVYFSDGIKDYRVKIENIVRIGIEE